jgi:hypothetical protein
MKLWNGNYREQNCNCSCNHAIDGLSSLDHLAYLLLKSFKLLAYLLPKSFKLTGFPICELWSYQMMAILEMRRVHYIRYIPSMMKNS